ncbi:Bug family tripartite tricarboxylate transporter substrate binding protein [Oricola thermophila]|uniref:Tripartite tricarboxylate transporter substrate binding protein n=1 Tax=Oricola thermophila TaxID=2742145 RepID=A0A6N1VFG1_9HYPH|nr:tripartite tricarboxylate transporter substrate binding protein [Oricola thermophila]QKV19666.1 tripartite tricarboxylate transporter substrate binding protein [Oricola thermophila]
MNTIFKTLLKLAASTALIVSAGAAWAEFPEKPITMYIGFNPGGAVDTTARLLQKNLEKELGVPVVAVQKPGGGGTVMATTLMTDKPDGYTIGMGASAAYVLAPQLNSDIKYKMIDDFDHIATVSIPQDALVVKADAPWNTYEELIADAKNNGKTLSLSSQVSVSRLMAIAIEKKEGIDIDVVPVKGGSVGIQQVLGGHTDMTWGASGWHAQVKAGDMKPLLSLGYERNADFPDIPTAQELGIDYAFVDTFMLSAPKGVPDDVLNTLATAVERALTPELRAELQSKMYLSADYRGPEATDEYLQMQFDQVKPFIEIMMSEDAK